MALDWFVCPPSLTLGPVRLGAAHQPYYGGASFTHDTRESAGRLVVYPALVWRQRGLHASAQQALAQDRQTFAPPPVQVWKAIFPDVLPRPWRAQGGGIWVPIVNLPAAPLQWAPEYPDRIAPPVWRRPNQLSPELFPTTVVTFGWRVTFPDAVARRTIPVTSHQATALGWQAIGTVRLEWLPQYPDLHWTVGLKGPWHQTFTQNLDPIPNLPSPELAWGPSYPDVIWPTVTLRPALQQVWASDRIRPVSPDLAWRSVFQDFVWRTTLSPAHIPSVSYVERIANIAPDLRMDWQADRPMPISKIVAPDTGFTRPPEVPASPVVWLADRQDPPDTPRLRPIVPISDMAAPIGAAFTTALQLGWQSIIPALHLRHRWAPTATDLVRPVLPTPNSWCVIFADDALLAPALTPERVMLPTLADETVITPRLLDEEVC